MDLNVEKANLEAQRDNAYAAYHQSLGALALIEVLLKEDHAELADTVKGMLEDEEAEK